MSVDEKNPLKVAELGESKVGRVRGGGTLFPDYP